MHNVETLEGAAAAEEGAVEAEEVVLRANSSQDKEHRVPVEGYALLDQDKEVVMPPLKGQC